MANDVQQLSVLLEARIRDFEKNMRKAGSTTDGTWQGIESRTKRGAKSVEDTTSSMAANVNKSLHKLGEGIAEPFKNVLPLIASAISAETVIHLADEWKKAGNAIASAGVESSKVQATLFNISDITLRSRGDFEATANLYARLTRASHELGASQAEVTVAVETVSKAMSISGATTQERQGALVELSQGLSAGVLQGQELRSIREHAPVIAKAIADEFGVSIGELKKLGEEGKLTSDRVFRGLLNAAPQVEEAFKKSTATVEDSFKAIETAAIRFAGTSGTIQTGTATITAGLQAVAKNFNIVGEGATALGAIITSRLIAAGLKQLVASFGLSVAASTAATASIAATGVAATTAAGGISVMTYAAAGLRSALALVGGPVGAAVLAVGAAALYAGQKSQEAAERERIYAQALEELEAKAHGATGAVNEHANAILKAAEAQAAEQTNVLSRDMEKTQEDVSSLTNQITFLLGEYEALAHRIGTPVDIQAIQKMRTGFDGSAEAALKLKEQIFALANANPRFNEVADSFSPLLKNLAGAIAHIDELKQKLADIKKDVANAANDTPENQRASDLLKQKSDAIEKFVKGQAELDKAVKHAELGEDKRLLEEETQRLIKEITDKGGIVNEDAAREAAKRILAAKDAEKDARGSSEDEYERASRRIQEHIDLLNAEATAVDKTSLEHEKAKIQQELLTAAKNADITVTDDVARSIDQLSQRYALAAQHLEQLQEQQKKNIQLADEFRATTKDSLKSFITDLRNGKSAAQALDNVLLNIMNRLINGVVDNLVDGLLGVPGSRRLAFSAIWSARLAP